MKIVISHDVDHIHVTEHWHDKIASKFLVRTLFELSGGRIPLHAFVERLKCIYLNKWENIDEIMKFDEKHAVPSTFFIGVANGLGLSYSLENARNVIERIENNGFDVGVHGISVNSLEDMNLEFSLFHDISKSQKFGIRTHYLRSSKNYLDYVEEIGYLYDSSNYLMGDPKIYKNIVLFPLNVMDGKLIETKPFGVQRSNYDFIFNKTKKIISNAENNNQEYFTLLFHDRYFSDEFPVWKKWYIEIIKYLISEGHTFINFENATELLKMNKLKN